MKSGNLNSEDGNEMLRRCKKLINFDYNDESIWSNYHKLYQFLRRCGFIRIAVKQIVISYYY